IGRRSIDVDNSVNQPPFGFVEIPSTQGVYDANGSFPVSGWVTDTDGIEQVDIVIDNLTYQSAVYGDARPDVYNAFPDLPASMFSAFIAFVDSSRIKDGVHTLAVRAKDRRGLERVIGRRTIQVFNSTNNLRPFGFVDEPRRDAVLYGTICGPTAPPPPISPLPPPFIPTAHITPVRGWALDIGTRVDTGRVAYAELMVDGVPWVNSSQCEYNATFGGYVNCYGLLRFDVARYYPAYPDAPRSGFFFTLDVGLLLNLGVRPGHHNVKVKVGDVEQTFAEIPNSAGIPVTFQCAEDNLDFTSIGYIDAPRNMDFVGGTILIHGWAADENSGGVRNVEIWIDGVMSGTAQYGFPRTDVRAAIPTVVGSLNSGWRFTFDTRQLSDARHRVTVVVVDAAGNRTTIGSADFYVDNAD
ncbi:MAG TPA: Ig-like domain-containing protein, partial [Thermoanaerobaculia bacterium]